MIERLFALETFGIKLGLENITRLCEALGHPERSFTSLHVAGTNGKGSVTAMVHSALLAAGIRAARYTSPHLMDLSERFVIGNAPVDDTALHAVAEDVLNCADRLRETGALTVQPTFFEATTAMAFELFRRAHVEVAVIEVGLGGRFDSTNVISAVAGAITTIDFDHQQYLGRTLASIAFEKAGIIKPGMTVVVGALPAEALSVVRTAGAERGATIVGALDDTRCDVEMQDGRARLTIATPRAQYGPLTLGLRGAHQVGNALVAVRLLEAANDAGIAIAPAAIARGLETTEWPARLEMLTLDSNRRMLLDAAHNAEGARALADYLRRWHPERPPLVIGVSTDKDVEAIMHSLIPVTSLVIATAAPSPRAMAAEDLARHAQHAGAADVHVEPEPLCAVELAFAAADTICVAGSIFLAGAVRDAVRRRAILQ